MENLECREKLDLKRCLPAHTHAANTCEEGGLHRLATEIKDSKKLSLRPFVTVKTHKEGAPFRVIVENRDTWQTCIASFRQSSLDLLPVGDPMLIGDSRDIISFPRASRPVLCFSVDVTDLFYNIVQRDGFMAAEDCIDSFGAVRF